MVVKFTRQRLRAGGLFGALAAAVLIAGCGSSNSSSSAGAAPSTSAAAGAASTASGVAISTTKGSVGTYLTGASGRAIYLWMADTGPKSNCTGPCAKFWPPVLANATPTVSGGASASDLGTTTRADGTKQVTYKGHPLYYFLEDPTAGTDKGQGSSNFGAKWWLVTPSGTAITTKGSSGGGSSNGGGSGYGGSAY